MENGKRQVAKLVASFGITFGAASVGAVASVSARQFYAGLEQPSWAPPGWVFGPVWSALYALMAFALWLVWRQGPTRSRVPELSMFGGQLLANALWSWLFFKWHLGGWAFYEILLLLALICLSVSLFWRRSRLAALLLLPYLAWVCFAAALAYAVWQANPEQL